MFFGFTSRWITFRAWRYDSASRSWRMCRLAVVASAGLSLYRSASVSPSRCSSTRQNGPRLAPSSRYRTTLGWPGELRVRKISASIRSRSVLYEAGIAFLEDGEMSSRNFGRLLRIGRLFRQVGAADQTLGRGNRLLRVVWEGQVTRLGQWGRELFLGLRYLGGAFVLGVRQVGGAFALRLHRIGRGLWFTGIRAKHRIDGVLIRRSDRAFVLGRHHGDLQFRRLGFRFDLRAARVAELCAFPVLGIARRTLGHVHHRFGFFFPMIVVDCRKSFFAASLSWRPLRATVAWASRIVVATSLSVGFARIAVAAPASVAMVRMIVSAFWRAVASLDCTARCMRTVASAELRSVRGYGFVSTLDSRGSSVKPTSTSCVTSTNENRSNVAFPAGRAGTPMRKTSVCCSPAIRSRSGTV